MKDILTFSLFTVDRQFPSLKCDSVKLNVADSVSGKFSGSYGIRKGHAKAVFSLAEGTTEVYKDGKLIFSAHTSDGFATVEDNEVRVTADFAEEK